MGKKLYAFLFLLSVAISVFLMIYLDVYSDFLTAVFNLIFFAIINLVLVIIIHEFGHLVFGLISGYKFVSFRIFCFLIYKDENDKIRFTTQSFLPTLVGQCFMVYPYKEDNAPFKLFNYGGLIFSYAYSFIFIILVLFGNNTDLTNLFLISGFLVSIIINLSNSVIDDNVINDLTNIKEIKKNDITKKCFFNQLEVMGNLSRGGFFNDTSFDINIDDFDIKVTLQIATIIFNYYSKMEILKFEEAKVILDKLYDNIHSIHHIYKDSLIYTYLFHTIVFENDLEKANLLVKRHKLKEKLEKDNKVNAEMNQRLYLAYKIYLKEDFTNIEKDFIKAKKVIKKSPFIRERFLLDSWVNTMHTYYVKRLDEIELEKKETEIE